MRYVVLACLFCMLTSCHTEESMELLPVAHYHPDSSDPPWLAYATQFHGHLGPWALAGVRAGSAARQAAQANGYFDVDVTVEGSFANTPNSCFLDGLQVSTGATLGKHNLKWVEAEEIVVRLRNTVTDDVVEVRPTPKLMELLGSIKPQTKADQVKADQVKAGHDHDHDHHDHALEATARQVARMPENEILRVQSVRVDE